MFRYTHPTIIIIILTHSAASQCSTPFGVTVFISKVKVSLQKCSTHSPAILPLCLLNVLCVHVCAFNERKQAHFSDDVNEQLQGDGIMNQGVSEERTEVFPWTDLVVNGTQVRPDFVAMFNSTNSEWKRAACNQMNKSNNSQTSSIQWLMASLKKDWNWSISGCIILLWIECATAETSGLYLHVQSRLLI